MPISESAKESFQAEWLISNLRWLLLVSVALVSFLDIFVNQEGAFDAASALPQIFLLIVTALYNLATMLLLLYGIFPRAMPVATLLIDTILTIGFVITSGGLTSPLLFFALFPILTATLRFPWVISLLIALIIVVGCGFAGYITAPPDTAWSDLLPFAARSLILLLATLITGLVGAQMKQIIARTRRLEGEAEMRRLRAAQDMDSQQMDSQELESLNRALEMARRTLAVYERQAAGYTSLSIPAQLEVDLKEQRRKVAELEEKLAQSSHRLSLSEAVAGYQRDLEDARANGNRPLEGTILSQLGAIYADAGELHRAIEHYEQSIAIARELGNRQAEAIRLQNLGMALLRLADAEPDQSEACLSRAADALRWAMESFDALGAAALLGARTRYHLGRCYHRLGRWREAIALLEHARETFSRRKARPELAHALLELGQLYHLTHDFESAYIYLKDALRLFRRMEDADGIAVTQEALGSLALQTARPSEAIVSLQEARRGYAALRRDERVRAVDDLLRIAHQARQPIGEKGAPP